MNLKRNRKGFSLLELLAVVTILGIIAAVVISRFSTTSYTAKKKLNAHNKAVVNATVERYYMDTGNWPSNNLKQLSLGIKNHVATTGQYPTGGWGYFWIGDPDRGRGRHAGPTRRCDCAAARSTR